MIRYSYEALIASGEIESDAAQKSVVNALQDLSERLEKQVPANKRSLFSLFQKPEARHIEGLYIWGSVGRGKTMLMDLFHENLGDEIKAKRLHFHEFMRDVHDFLHDLRQKQDDGSKAARESRMSQYADKIRKEADVLCFDEFHVTDIGDAMILGGLFSALFDRGIAVVATSNWPPERLYEGGLQRDRFIPFIDLIKDRMKVMELSGSLDYRAEVLREAGTYFYPLSAVTKGRMDDLFRHVTQNEMPKKDIVNVKGREIEVSQAVGDVARFTFAELCERPRGANDYLAIAEKYHTVFLDRLPKFAYDRRNEVKRFMTLIDAFYDQGVKLIIWADAPVDHLYRGDDYEFEFERTVSRLQEMQSQEYLDKSKRHNPA